MSGFVLSRNQRRALGALLENRTIALAAEASGLTERTLRRYLDDPAFKAELSRHESAAIDEAGRMFIRGLPVAQKTLWDLMTKGRTESIRLRASIAWATLHNQFRDFDIDARLAQLEKDYYGKSKG